MLARRVPTLPLRSVLVAVVMALAWTPAVVTGQGVTTASISGVVRDASGAPLADVNVVAVHVPSGTRYQAQTRASGVFVIPGMRVGGPYEVRASRIGFGEQVRRDVMLNLGVATNLQLTLSQQAVALEGIMVEGESQGAIISSDRTGAATQVSRVTLSTLPTIDGRLGSFARLSPQYSRNFSFAGQDNRLNNITVDGSYFNNSFGLAGQPGDRTGVAPISMQAIEQVQINVAPYDVRQGNFVGAGVNTVTRSGGNQLAGSLYYLFRNDGLVGTEAGDNAFDPGSFDYTQYGGWLSGPILQNKLFFFLNYEDDGLEEPGTTWLANRGSDTPGQNNATRVMASDLDQLSSFLDSNFDYVTGPYQGYLHETPATRFLGKLDYALNDRHKLSVRYTHLDSRTDVLSSNSSSLGFGSRRTSQNALNFQNSNYQILENIRSVVGEWNAVVGRNMANQLIVGYTNQDESRASRGTFFPMVDVLEGGLTYTTFGFEPFTPNNELRYSSYQFQNNFTRFGEKHDLTFGVSAEYYESENVFFPGSQSAYVYNSLADFFTDANDYLANPNRTTSPVNLRRFQVRWSNIPGQEKPVQPLEVFFAGIYGQDEWRVSDNLRLTLGMRVDAPFFGETGFVNPEVPGFTFRDEDGSPVSFATDKLPDPNLLFSPRVGFNWDVAGDRVTQVRGGSGIFTGKPAYVWISNQIGNNGVLTGFERLDNTTARPFNPDPNHYKPAEVSGAPASNYELALSDPDFRFPQLWRTNLGVDRQLPWNLVGTAEVMFSQDVNGIYYINANLPAPSTQLSGPDERPRWTAGNKIVSKVDNAVVLKNQNEGYSWNVAASLERPLTDGIYAKAGYGYGVTKNTVDPGSIAFGSWNNNAHRGDPNNPGLAYSANSPGHRAFAAVSYRGEYFDFGATTIGLFVEGRTAGNISYVYSGDLNGDGGTSNDLLYIPRDVSEMNFEAYSSGGQNFTAEEQAAAFDAFIEQDGYLSEHRGEYVQRGAVFLPMYWSADLSLTQELFGNIRGRRNAVQFRADILNFTNLLKSSWGVGDTFITDRPVIFRSVDGNGQPRFRFFRDGDDWLSESTRKTAGFGDVYRVQFSLRYTFN